MLKAKNLTTLEEALEQAAILSDVKPEIAIVDRGYRGAEPDGVKVYHPGRRRGITRTLRAMVRRRSAISVSNLECNRSMTGRG